MLTALVFDLEANGLTPDKVWCIAIEDLHTREKFFYDPTQIEEGIQHLLSADVLMGHNIIDFDIPTLINLYPDLIDHTIYEGG